MRGDPLAFILLYIDREGSALMSPLPEPRGDPLPGVLSLSQEDICCLGVLSLRQEGVPYFLDISYREVGRGPQHYDDNPAHIFRKTFVKLLKIIFWSFY